MNGNQPVPIAAGPTPAQQRAAARAVALRSRDTDECRRLLDMLGLLPLAQTGRS